MISCVTFLSYDYLNFLCIIKRKNKLFCRTNIEQFCSFLKITMFVLCKLKQMSKVNKTISVPASFSKPIYSQSRSLVDELDSEKSRFGYDPYNNEEVKISANRRLPENSYNSLDSIFEFAPSKRYPVR